MNPNLSTQTRSIGRASVYGLGLTILMAACGDQAEPSSEEQSLTNAKAMEVMIPDLHGDFHVVKSVSLLSLPSSIIWKSSIDAANYTVAASKVPGGVRVTTSKTGSDHQLILQSSGNSFSIESVRGAEGRIGMTYGGALGSPVAGAAATADDLPAVASYFEEVLADDAGISAALALFALPQILTLTATEDPPTESASFLGAVLGFLKGVIKVLGGLFGGGGGGGDGPGCPGGSSASCTDSSGHQNTVTCSDCSAHCTQTYGVGGTLCACGCGL